MEMQQVSLSLCTIVSDIRKVVCKAKDCYKAFQFHSMEDSYNILLHHSDPRAEDADGCPE